MKLEFGTDWIEHEGRILKVEYPIMDARTIGGFIIVLHDDMHFARGVSARNLFAYKLDGTIAWRADDIGQGAVDAYTNFLSENPLVVGNFAGFNCTVDISSGTVLSTQFTK